MESTPVSPPRSPSRRRPRSVRALGSTIGLAILLATLFNLWTPSKSMFAGSFSDKLGLMLTAQPESNFVATPQPQLRIGIVAGHAGNDAGATCLDSERQHHLDRSRCQYGNCQPGAEKIDRGRLSSGLAERVRYPLERLPRPGPGIHP